jgi:hypothetical protein
MTYVTGVDPTWLSLPCKAFFDRLFDTTQDPTRLPAAAFLARL